MADFEARLGDPAHRGFTDQAARLARIAPGTNPYVTGHSLPPDSPVFYGRGRELAETLGVLRQPEKPGSVSVLGERRFGKSSFLNQVWQALGAEPGLCCVHATTQPWEDATPGLFFGGLHRAILAALEGNTRAPRPKAAGEGRAEVRDYSGLRDFIRPLACDGLRFVLILDELERITGAPCFDADFFSNLRALGERPEYRFGFLISSREPLKELCSYHRIEESSFWNIFGFPQYIGLLDEQDARALAAEPLGRSFPTIPRQLAQGLLAQDVAICAGRHPALIQVVMSECWRAFAVGQEADFTRIEWIMSQHFSSLLTDLLERYEGGVLAHAVRSPATMWGPATSTGP